MLNDNEKSVLNFINLNCKNESYAVFTCEDILTSFPAFLSADSNSVKNAINNLFLKGYIRLKYNDGTTFCVSTTEQGLNYKEENAVDKQPSLLSLKAIVGWCVFSSFLGGFVGAITALFISRILGG